MDAIESVTLYRISDETASFEAWLLDRLHPGLPGDEPRVAFGKTWRPVTTQVDHARPNRLSNYQV